MAARSPVRQLARALYPELQNLSRDQRDAVNALARHLLFRFEQSEHEPLDSDGRTFLTVAYMQRRLRELGARKTGEKAVEEAIRWRCASGILENMYDPETQPGEVKKPRRRPERMAAREKFAPASQETEGGRDAQLPSSTLTGGGCSGSVPSLPC